MASKVALLAIISCEIFAQPRFLRACTQCVGFKVLSRMGRAVVKLVLLDLKNRQVRSND
jgi:hypothetical protein